jgi:dihydropteroate synthase
MGILNITEDSFSDGGRWLSASAAAEHGRQMASQGADIIDIGAESTRPGAVRVDPETEKSRVVTAVSNLSDLGIPLSIDTTRSSVARAALEAGASIINDVSGGQLDTEIPRVVAHSDCLYVVQHWRGWLTGGKPSGPDAPSSHYEQGVVPQVHAELMRQVDAVLAAGVDPEKIVLDPGLGFSKPGPDLNMPLMRQLELFKREGYPVLIGASRKRFIADILKSNETDAGDAGASDRGRNGTVAAAPSNERKDTATAVLSAFCEMEGAWAVRVHDVQKTVDALAVARAWKNSGR